MYPTFFDYEIFGGEKFASYRMRSGYIFTVNDVLLFASGHDAAGRGGSLNSWPHYEAGGDQSRYHQPSRLLDLLPALDS